MERIKLNLIPSGVAPVVHVSQYDEGREFACDLFEGANVYTLDGTETLTVQVRKPDGHLVTESVTNTSDSYIVVTTTEQMCAVHGTNLANLKIEKGSIEIASLNFLMEVERDPLENGDPSESFVDNLNTQIYNAVADQYDSNNVIFDNAPTSGHNQPYTVTSDGIKSTIDNLELDDLHDVTISGAVSGEALTWDGSKWVNGTVSTVGSIDDLNDVDTTGKVDNSSLVYNSNDSEWQAKKLTVTLTQAEYDQLKLDGDLVEGTNYIITDGQNVTCDLGDLDDVSISGSPSGKVLMNNGSAWVDARLNYGTGSLITLTEMTCAGMIWNSRKTIQFFVPLDKPIESGKTATITGGRFYIYSNLGTANDQFSNVTIDFCTPKANGVEIKLTRSTAFYNSGNDTSITVWLDGLTIGIT